MLSTNQQVLMVGHVHMEHRLQLCPGLGHQLQLQHIAEQQQLSQNGGLLQRMAVGC